MATHVYANKSEIASKNSTGDANGAFPDVCFTTPPPVAAGTPVPFPNNCVPKKLKKISKSVLIKGGGIALENKSFFKSSSGSPASNFKKGFISGVKHSKGFHQSWSANVKVEGKGVARHMDLVTHNHSNPTNGAFNLFDSNKAVSDACENDKKKIADDCKVEENKTEKYEEKGETKERSINQEGTKGWREKYCGPLNDTHAANVDHFDKFEQEFINKTDSGALNNDGIKSAKSTYEKAKKRIEKATYEPTKDKETGKITKTPADKKREAERSAKNKYMSESFEEYAKANPCLSAKKCELVSYNDSQNKPGESEDPKKAADRPGCCYGQTGHHLLPDSMFRKPEDKVTGLARNKQKKEDCWEGYSEGSSPTICVEGGASRGSHGLMHDETEIEIQKYQTEGKVQRMDFDQAKKDVASIVAENYSCEQSCIEAQLEEYYNKAHSCEGKEKKVVAHTGKSGGSKLSKAGQKDINERIEAAIEVAKKLKDNL